MVNLEITFTHEKIGLLTQGKISSLTRSVASKVRSAMQRSTPKDTGKTRRSWTPVRKVEGGYSFGSELPQAYFLEYGSEVGKKPWPSAGPRTVYYEDRVYSSQAPKGISTKADIEVVAQEVADELMAELLKDQE